MKKSIVLMAGALGAYTMQATIVSKIQTGLLDKIEVVNETNCEVKVYKVVKGKEELLGAVKEFAGGGRANVKGYFPIKVGETYIMRLYEDGKLERQTKKLVRKEDDIVLRWRYDKDNVPVLDFYSAKAWSDFKSSSYLYHGN